VVMLLGAGCTLMFGLAVAAIILTGACKIARVPPPNFFPAMGICFGVSLAVGCIQLLIAGIIAVASGSTDALSGSMSPEELQGLLIRAAPIAFCLHPFISAAIFSIALSECSFGRGLLVWLAQLVVVVVIGGAFLGLAYGIHAL